MQYISAEEFLKQDKEVQEVFWDWWTPRKGNINYSPVRNGIEVVEIENNATQRRNNGYIPLLTEGQLRQFIEDMTKSNLSCWRDVDGYRIYLFTYQKDEEDYKCIEIKDFKQLGDNVLQAYWKVAVQIAKNY